MGCSDAAMEIQSNPNIQIPDDPFAQLYDIQADAIEMNDLARKPDTKKRFKNWRLNLGVTKKRSLHMASQQEVHCWSHER